MDDVVLARHGESETAARGVVGGDAPLTAAGREQARALGEALTGCPLDLCVTSAALRARETAAIALGHRQVPTELDSALGDVEFGAFAGRPLADYRDWMRSHLPAEAPEGGESRVETLVRFAGAFRRLLAREERHLLVVAHGLTLSAVADEIPRPVVAGVPYGSWRRVGRDELAAAVARIERWCEAPAW
jgi:2,3-bisphosphoglycerate-dependent phosphoglycerate mutase